MTGILPALLVTTLAFASGDSAPRDRGGKKAVGPPLRMGSVAVLRSGVTSAGAVEIGAQVLRKDQFGLDLSAAISTPQRVDNLQPWRQINHYSLIADGVFAVSPTVNLGPSASLSYRAYRQEWYQVGAQAVPALGARTSVGLLTQRTWQFQLTARGTLDLVQTQMAFETAEVRALNPWELQIGARFAFARQRSPLVPEERR